MEELKKVKEMFQDKLQVKAGIEIGLQDWTLRQASNIALNYPFDFVIASIHLVDGIDPISKSILKTGIK